MISQLAIDFAHFHFANPLWLWTAMVIPLVWLMFLFFYRPYHPSKRLESFIDSHLLPYLMVGTKNKKGSYVKMLLLWSVVWSCLTLALAGPRWSFREIEMSSKDQSLVILLDLSQSMNARDIKPSRLARAKQKIEDLINHSAGVKIGLVAFAADPHMITPLTDDKETIRHLLPSLETDLVYIQGSRLSPTLEMASVMLDSEPGSNKAVLIITDGEFEDGSALTLVKKMADKGITVHTMGMGTVEGTILQDAEGNSLKNNGAPILSKLARGQLEEISKTGKGNYFEGSYFGGEETAILKQLEERAHAMEAGKKSRLWDDRFYLLILPTLPILLLWFRRGAIFLMPLMFFLPSCGLQAVENDFKHAYFMNSEEIGKQALDEGDFESAADAFQDSYRKGVAYYKSGNFVEAEKMFRQSSRPEVAADAAYNRGNALVQQQKLKKAVSAYENVLKKWPEHIKAKENLALVKKMMEQQKQEQQQENPENQDDENDEDQDSSESGNKGKQQKKESSDQKNQDEEDNEPQDSENNGQDDNNHPEDQDQSNQKDEETPDQNEGQDNQDLSEQEQNRDEEEDGQNDDAEEQQAAELNEGQEDSQKEGQEMMGAKSQEDQDADFWLNRLSNDPKDFLKNKFYIESKKNGTTKGMDPW